MTRLFVLVALAFLSITSASVRGQHSQQPASTVTVVNGIGDIANRPNDVCEPSATCIWHVCATSTTVQPTPIEDESGVYADQAGVYPPELTYFDRAKATVYHIQLDAAHFKSLTAHGKCSNPRNLP